MRKALNFRTGRVVAIVRSGLALALLATTWTLESGRFSGDAAARLVAVGYIVAAFALLGVTLLSWWQTHRLRLVALAIDAAVLFAALALPAPPPPAMAGVLMALYAFILLGAAIGWPRNGAPIAALVVVAGHALAVAAVPLAPGLSQWLGPHLMAMIALAGLVAWMGQRIGKIRPPRLDLPDEGEWPEALSAMLDFVSEQADAAGAAAAWQPDDEPWVFLHTAGTLGDSHERLGPDQFPPAAQELAGTVLFDRRRQRQLVLLDSGAVVARKGALVHPLLTRCSAPSGLLLTVRAQGGTCTLLLTGVEDVAADHLRLARAAGVEIGHALDRRAVMVITREADRTRIRDTLARDLHDSVAQSLAGASFRIEALRLALANGRAIDADLDALQRSLEREERTVQRLILQLRDRDQPDRPCDLVSELDTTLNDTGARWGIACALTADPGLPTVPLLALHEFEQILREAVANAVRHGNAARVDVHLRKGEGQIVLDIIDDGTGFPARPRPLQPRSIAARVADMGGRMTVESQPGRSVLHLAVPDRWSAA